MTPDGDIGIAAQVAFFHVRFRDPQPAQQLAQADQVLGGFIGGAQVGLGDHFHQRHAAAVEIHQPLAAGILGLAGIFFDVQLVDAHPADVALASGSAAAGIGSSINPPFASGISYCEIW